MKYVALLRAINVGGRNLMRMADITACLVDRKFECVSTYIQSGNILFESDVSDVAKLTASIENALFETFAQEARVFLRSHRQMKKVVAEAPKQWKDGAALRRNVAFVRRPLTATTAAAAINPKPGVDSVKPGDGVVYMTTVMARATESGLSKVVSKAIYRDMTVRNYTTCQKILALMDGDRS
ncbi:MAG: DUF1697 domain-containing protein [Vicinamibacterales bacterium]